MTTASSAPSRVLLVGAGHAHLHLLKRADELVDAGAEVAVVDPGDFWYSGAATGVLAGLYPPDLATIDVGGLAAAGGVRRIRDRLVSVDPDRRLARLESGATLAWDVLSLDVGSVPRAAFAGAISQGIAVKPIPRLLRLVELLRDAAVERRPLRVVVVGGGASGCEVALALERRALREGAAATITVVTREEVLPGFPRGARRSMRRVMESRRVEVREGRGVEQAGGDEVLLDDGSSLPADLLVDATGLVAPPVVEELGFPTGPDGGLRVDETLRSVASPRVFAVGDCAFFEPRPLPKVGVHAVRQAPVLLRNIRAVLDGGALRPFRPQRRYLLVLSLGDGTGLAVRGPLWMRGRTAFRLKDILDRGFLERHRPPGG